MVYSTPSSCPHYLVGISSPNTTTSWGTSASASSHNSCPGILMNACSPSRLLSSAPHAYLPAYLSLCRSLAWLGLVLLIFPNQVTAQEKPIPLKFKHPVTSLAVSPDGRIVAVARRNRDASIQLFDAKT